MKFVHYAIYAFSVLVVGTVVYLIQNGHKGFTNSAFHAKFAAESERSNNDKSWDLDSACNLTEYNDCTPSGRRWTHEKRDTKEQRSLQRKEWFSLPIYRIVPSYLVSRASIAVR